MLDLLVLAMLAGRDRYGYDISESLARRIDIADGTIYPLLRKLKAEGYVTAYLSEDSGGPPRKYYSLTQTGRRLLVQERAEWRDFAARVEEMLQLEEMNEAGENRGNEGTHE